MNRFPGKLALQQRVLPHYRVPFFDLLASACDRGMSLFAGLPRPAEGITTASQFHTAEYRLGRNLHLFGGAFYLCHQQALLTWLQEVNPDALIVEANPRCISTPAAVRWMRRRGKPVLGWGLGAGNGGVLWKQFVRQFDAMIAYSRRGAGEYAALGFPHERIFLAHNAVAHAPLQPCPSRPFSVGVRPVVLFVGRLQARKRVDALLRACARLQNVRLVIVGDGPERGALQSLAEKIFPEAEFAGEKRGEEIGDYFAQADLFVLPGTGGLAVHQAMSHGLPVIVAKGDGTQDDLVRTENGWQVQPDDFDALLSAMQEALSDPARLRRMGEESYRIVKEEINIERMVEAFVAALNALTGK
jgi:glycosyltransferase involved in cell wall biosynthesis